MHRPSRLSLRVGPACALLLALSSPRLAHADSAPLVTARIAELKPLVAEKPKDVTDLFDGAFLAQVPAPKLVEILQQFYRQAGPVAAAVRTSVQAPYRAEYRFLTRKGRQFPVRIGLSDAPPHRITALWFGPISVAGATIQDGLAELKKLPGEVSFALWELGTDAPRPLAELNATKALAIGSTFKLYILGALIAALEKGEKRWDELVRLRRDRRSLPSGILHDWPEETPLTLQSLASLMVSISDNTATDHLLFAAGREKVEAMLAPMGVATPARNRPFLATRELFLLKERGAAGLARRTAYLKLDEAARRRYLERELARRSLDGFHGLELTAPTAIGALEWYASAADLCRTMDWLRRHSVGRASPARGLLRINKGLLFADGRWRYVGYKGGSEPGVLNFTWLLERKDGKWFALSVGWNDAKAPVAETRLIEIAQGMILVLEGELDAKKAAR